MPATPHGPMTSGRPRRALDPRTPLVLDTRELGRRPGSMRRLSRTVPAPTELAVALARVLPGTPVELDLRLEAVMEGVLVSGTASAVTDADCARCLEPVSESVVAEVQELFGYDDAARHAAVARQDADVADGAEGEAPRLDGDLLDLEPVLRDAVVLALPLRPLCRPDCRGLCSECGARLDDDPGHRHDAGDPRWAALAGLPRGERSRPTDTSNPTDRPDPSPQER